MKVRLKSKVVIDGKTEPDEFLKILLKNRGVKEKFLIKTDIDDLKVADFGIDKKDFSLAVKIIKESIEKQKRIVIYGDYDVDGITATAILWRAMWGKNKNISPFVPDREEDGYGINYESFERFCKKNKIKADLLITVDNGVVAQKEIGKIKKDGVKVIVIDHHKKNAQKIMFDGLVHSTKTSASVLAYLVAKEIGKTNDIDLAACGLVADFGDLSIGANRNLAIAGIDKLKRNPNNGLAKLMNLAGAKKDDINEDTIGYVLGPRINAAGRMESATQALRLLCFDDDKILSKLAKTLEENNRQRQNAQRLAMEKVGYKTYKKKIIIETGKFHPGIIGLMAGKLAETSGRPAIVISNIDGTYKGSARSAGDFDITTFLRRDEKLFVSLGGHSGAAGFSINKTNYAKWLKKIGKRMEDIKINMRKTDVAEASMKLTALKIENYQIVEKLRPFGQNNSKPLFLFNKLKVTEARLVGNGQKHLKLKFDDPETANIEKVEAGAIAFGKGFFKKNIDECEYVNVLAYLNLNEWMGKRSVELLVKEIWV